MKLIDLSSLIEHTDRSPVDHTEIEYADHKEGAKSVSLGGRCPPEYTSLEDVKIARFTEGVCRIAARTFSAP